jgi:hypothetical protein
MNEQFKGLPIGINYEAGRIVTHILKYSNCVGIANCQIAMDAPYAGRVADDSVRSSGRSETQFTSYDETITIAELTRVFHQISNMYTDTKLVVQIARGRSGIQMYADVIKPIIQKCGFTDVDVKFGYRTTDYYIPVTNDPFVFVNIGMFAVLTNVDSIRVGQLCSPVITYEIIDFEKETGFKSDFKPTFTNDRNILTDLGFTEIILWGIADQMAFVTPSAYPEHHILKLTS